MTRLRMAALCLATAVCACGPSPGPPAVKLTLVGLGVEAGSQLREDALDEFTQQTGIEVDVMPTLGTSSEQLGPLLRVLEKRLPTPDVFLVDLIWPGTLHTHLLDLKPYLDGSAGQHVPALIENNTVGGRLTGLPLYMSAGVLFFRADLLRKYGFGGPPKTWSELDAMATAIQRGERKSGHVDFWGFVWQGAAYEGLTCNALEWQAAYGGGSLLERDGTVAVNNAGTVRAFEEAAGWIGRISPRSVLSYTESDTNVVFRTGRAAFMRQWNSGYGNIAEAMKPGTLGVATLPTGPGGRGCTVGGFQIAVSAYSNHRPEAARLALYLSERDVQRRRALRRGYMPTLVELQSDPQILRALPHVAVLRDTPGDEWVRRPSSVAGAKYAEVSRAYYTAVHGILAGQLAAGPAMAELEKTLARITGRKGPGKE